jgi:hypothetical protein
MSQSAALVPVPFYPPARTGTGSLSSFVTAERRPLLLERQQQTAVNVAMPAHGMAYDREGSLIADLHIGRLLNIYA